MNSKLFQRIGVIVAAIIPVAIVGVLAFGGEDGDDIPLTVVDQASTNDVASGTEGSQSAGTDVSAVAPETTTTTAATTINIAPTNSVSTSTFKNGTYSATGSYRDPDGTQSITLTLTIENDIVTNTSMVANGRGETRSWQNFFAQNYSPLVIGKSLSDLNLTNVSGASLTPIGFNAAVASIQAQAK